MLIRTNIMFLSISWKVRCNCKKNIKMYTFKNTLEIDIMLKQLISVIIPVYNVEAYLVECLDSVINQTYKELEIILVNDGSTDRSLDILEKYKAQHSNITIINQENSGQSVARNKGIEVSTGDYIYFLDSDDYIELDTFEQLINAFNDKDVDLIRFSAEAFTDNIKMNLDKRKYNFDKYFNEQRTYEKEEFLSISTKAFTPSPVLYIMKRELLIESNLRFIPGIIHEDDLFTVEVFLNANKAIYLPNAFYRRRYRKGSTMTIESINHRKNSFHSRCIILDELENLLNTHFNISEVELIKKRITKTIQLLARNYPDLPNSYKVSKIKKVKVPFLFYRYHYQYIRKVIACFIRRNKT